MRADGARASRHAAFDDAFHARARRVLLTFTMPMALRHALLFMLLLLLFFARAICCYAMRDARNVSGSARRADTRYVARSV